MDPLDEHYQSMIGVEQVNELREHTVTTVYAAGPSVTAGIVERD